MFELLCIKVVDVLGGVGRDLGDAHGRDPGQMGPQLEEAGAHVLVAQGAVALRQLPRDGDELVTPNNPVPVAKSLVEGEVGSVSFT